MASVAVGILLNVRHGQIYPDINCVGCVQPTRFGTPGTSASTTAPDAGATSALPSLATKGNSGKRVERDLALTRPAQNPAVVAVPRNGVPNREEKTIVQEKPIIEEVADRPGVALLARPVDDMAYLNPSQNASLVGALAKNPAFKTKLKTKVESKTETKVEAEVTRLMAETWRGDTFVTLDLPAIAGGDGRAVQAAMALYRQQAAIVDARLARKVRLGVKALPLGDLCRQLTEETGIQIAADGRVADDNVTIFCNPRPLRDILRQISAHFGFQWQREGEQGAYRYTLTQSLRSQLLEEEARNQDQDEAIIALDRAMDRYRPIRGLDTTGVRALVDGMKPKDAIQLFPLTTGGWLPANLYFGLSAEEMQTLRSGQPLNFSMSPEDGQAALPAALRPEILKAFDEVRINPHPGESGAPLMSHNAPADSLPLSAAKDIQISASLQLDRKQLGTYTLKGDIFLHVTTDNAKDGIGHGITLAEVTSPSLGSPQNALANQKHAQDPKLQKRVSIVPKASCTVQFGHLPDVEGISQMLGAKATTADVLEAIFRATGRDVFGDFYTRLYTPSKVTIENTTLFDGLNRLGDTMHARWTPEAGWLKFRSIRWFYERPQEVPARKLTRWAASRRKQGALTIDDLSEIAQLSNAQLDSLTTYQGALARYDLKEWNYARSTNLREHWRFLATLPTELRQETITPKGLVIEQLAPALQKRFLPLALNDPQTTLRPNTPETAGISLRIEYEPLLPRDGSFHPLIPGNPVIFVYTYDKSEPDFGRRQNLIGPFNGIFGGSEVMSENRRKR